MTSAKMTSANDFSVDICDRRRKDCLEALMKVINAKADCSSCTTTKEGCRENLRRLEEVVNEKLRALKEATGMGLENSSEQLSRALDELQRSLSAGVERMNRLDLASVQNPARVEEKLTKILNDLEKELNKQILKVEKNYKLEIDEAVVGLEGSMKERESGNRSWLFTLIPILLVLAGVGIKIWADTLKIEDLGNQVVILERTQKVLNDRIIVLETSKGSGR